MVKGSARMYADGVVSSWMDISGMAPEKTKDYLDGMGGIVHTEEETDDYLKDIRNLFKRMGQAGSDVAEIWEDLEETHLNYNMGKTDNHNFKDYLRDRSEDVFAHMKGYWSKLLTE